MRDVKFGTGLDAFGAPADRFMPGGYKEAPPLEEMFAAAGKVDSLEGVELLHGLQVDDENADKVKDLLDRYDLSVSAILADVWGSRKWSTGSLIAADATVREEAVEEVNRTVDLAEKLDADIVNLWFGQDGNDYPFQMDYAEAWEWMIEGLQKCADYNEDAQLTVEYKPMEPRKHSLIDTAAKTLLLLDEVNRSNVSLLLDIGHSFYAGENVSEVVSLVSRKGKLGGVHLNDNYRFWDDDMLVGSVHTIETLEFLYWLERVDYDGWYTLDIFPYREDGVKAARESIEWIKAMRRSLDEVGMDRIVKVVDSRDSIEISKLMRQVLM